MRSLKHLAVLLLVGQSLLAEAQTMNGEFPPFYRSLSRPWREGVIGLQFSLWSWPASQGGDLIGPDGNPIVYNTLLLPMPMRGTIFPGQPDTQLGVGTVTYQASILTFPFVEVIHMEMNIAGATGEDNRLVVTLTLTNTAPVTGDLAVVAPLAQRGGVQQVDLLQVATDVENDPLRLDSVGTVTPQGCGTLTWNGSTRRGVFTPGNAADGGVGGFVGTCALRYRMRDDHLISLNEGVLTVAVGNRAPSTPDLTLPATTGTPATVDVLASASDPEQDPLSYVRSSTPSPAGCATVSWDTTQRRFDVTPVLGGTCAFTYTLTDTGLESTGTVTLDITATSYAVSGTVSGLSTGGSLVLRNNGGDDLTITGNGGFTFATPVALNDAYAVTVFAQPVGQTCVVTNASGSSAAPVTNVGVSCTTNTYVLGGSVSGLAGGETVALQEMVGGDAATVTTNGAFAFPSPLAFGTNYAVAVSSQPAGKTCVVSNGAGTMTGDVSNVTVTCAAILRGVGGVVSGLSSGGSLVLQNNSGDDLTVAMNGTFRFATPVAHGDPYLVSVLTQPSGQACGVMNGSGLATRDVEDVAITCDTLDAGSELDAGTPDAGSELDAGTPDAGTEADAGVLTDAGTQADGGGVADAGPTLGGEEPASCGCSSSTSALWWWPATVALVAIRRRRHSDPGSLTGPSST